MSCVKHWQRRALERLGPRKIVPLTVSAKDKYYLDGKRIYLLGTSIGIGTCSDLKDINIAVFGREKPASPRFPRNGSESICQWAALLRRPTEKELQEERNGRDIRCLLAVEGIKISKLEKDKGFNRVYFVLTGKKELYVNI